ncbi:MAG: Gldg family protein [Clostridiales Family XIII bacterium]|jgi:ABC-2 type transport system permease protein|nr:Gldg family protein [Clostridiales Family XIII bacterium]
MKAIIGREFRSYFQTITGWLYIAAITALYGLYLYVINLSYGDPKMSSSLGSVLFLSMITIPVLTMRSMAEERRSGTDQLLFTSPVSVGKVVLSKYLSCALIYTIGMAAICAAPPILRVFGNAPFAENYVAVLGFWLYGLCCIAIGIFASALTESQLISAILTFVFLFVGYMMGSITGQFFSSENLPAKILGAYDLLAPLDGFFGGNLSVTGIVYYLSVAALFLFLTTQVIQKRRWDVSVKRIKTGVFSVGFIAVGVAIVVGVNLVAGLLPAAAARIDVTSGKIYSLTSQTKDYLDALEKDVTIYVIDAESESDETVAGTLRDYADASKHVRVEYKDPSVSPTFYLEYTSEQVSEGSLIAVCGEVSRVIDYNALYVSEYDYNTYQSTVTGYDAEGLITSALQYVTNDELPTLYELTGHGETPLSGAFASAVSKANFTAESISLLNYDAVPDDARILIVNGPTSDLSESDANKLSAWLKAGGNAVVSLNYEVSDALPHLEAVLAEFGVRTVPGMVVESDANRYYQQAIYLLPIIGDNEYTADLGQSYVFAPYARGLSANETADETIEDEATGDEATADEATEDEGAEYLPILSTGDTAFSKTNIGEANSLDYGEGDVMGPFDVAAAVEKTSEAGLRSRLVVLGSHLILTDEADEVVSGSNAALFSNILSACATADETDIVIVPAKSYNLSSLMAPRAAALGIGLCYIAVVPCLLLILGIVIRIRRRRAR